MFSNVLSKLSIILPVKCFQIWSFCWQTSPLTISEQKIYKGWKQFREVFLVFLMPSCSWNMYRLFRFGQNFLMHLQSFRFVLLHFSVHSFKAKLPLACCVNMCESLLIFMSIYIKSNTFTVALLFYFCARLIENSL